MTRDEAIQVRRDRVRVEYWDPLRGGWRRGLIRRVSRNESTALVIETGLTRARYLPLEKLRRETP